MAKLLVISTLLCAYLCIVECRSFLNDAAASEIDMAEMAKRDSSLDMADDMAKRQHWSYGFAPGGKRGMEEMPADEMKRQHWSYGFAPGGKRNIDESEDGDNSVDKRQHWSYGFAPGGKRAFVNSENNGMTQARAKSPLGGGKRVLESLQNDAVDVDKRQHWSYGFAPGGKREFEEDNAGANENDVEKRQHWSYGFAPGGKRVFEPRVNMNGAPIIPMKRQHWSYGFAPGGKRNFNNEDTDNNRDKRQHWSYGFAPGGKRDLSTDEDMQTRENFRNSFLALREILRSEDE